MSPPERGPLNTANTSFSFPFTLGMPSNTPCTSQKSKGKLFASIWAGGRNLGDRKDPTSTNTLSLPQNLMTSHERESQLSRFSRAERLWQTPFSENSHQRSPKTLRLGGQCSGACPAPHSPTGLCPLTPSFLSCRTFPKHLSASSSSMSIVEGVRKHRHLLFALKSACAGEPKGPTVNKTTVDWLDIRRQGPSLAWLSLGAFHKPAEPRLLS